MTTIIDSHCHAWRSWPYQPAVPHPQQGDIDQLLFEMEQNGVDRALVVCAEIAGETDNNAYIADAVRANPTRLYQLADLDSHWKSTYHTAGAASRLGDMLAAFPLTGITHYLRDDDLGDWLADSADSVELFELLGSHQLIVSIHCKPHQLTAIRRLADRFPQVPLLIHHMAHPQIAEPAHLDEILNIASADNVFLKVSGFYYGTQQPAWNFPLEDMQTIVRAIYRRYGARRLLWGSDYPVCLKRGISYIQSIEILRHHCNFVSASDMDLIMGQSLHQLLEAHSDRP